MSGGKRVWRQLALAVIVFGVSFAVVGLGASVVAGGVETMYRIVVVGGVTLVAVGAGVVVGLNRFG